MEGLITLKRNKCEFLRRTTEHGNSHKKIIGVTETWAKHNFDGEYKEAFKGYGIYRSDRLDKDQGISDDPDHLVNRGGVMLLTSSDLPITPVLKFSNGNCEALVANLQTIYTAVVVFYRPSGENFSTKKYNEAIKKTKTMSLTRETVTVKIYYRVFQ